MSRSVFFETIRLEHRSLVMQHLAQGDQVYVFDFLYDLKRMGWLRQLLHDGRVQKIYTRFSKADGMAIDAAEYLYPRLSQQPVVEKLQQLFGGPEVDPILKSALVDRLYRYCFIRCYFQKHPVQPGTVFVPDEFLTWHQKLGSWAQKRTGDWTDLQMPTQSLKLLDALRTFRAWCRSMPVYLALGAYWLIASLGRVFSKLASAPKPIQTKYVYSVTSAFQARFQGPRQFDFLLDGQQIHARNTVFLVDPDGEGSWMDQAKKRGYRLILRSKFRGWRSLCYLAPKDLSLGSLGQLIGKGLCHWRTPEWVHQVTLTGLKAWIEESLVSARLQAEKTIYSNQYGLVPRWRNLFIRRLGGQSWWFAYSTGGGFLYWREGVLQGDNEHGGRHRYWAYQNADHFVAPCEPLINFHREHNQEIEHYHNVGNLWSELILREVEGMDRLEVHQNWFGQSSQAKKVVAWFDTTFVEAPNSPSTFTEAIKSYQDILRLVQEHEDLLLVIKPSKDGAYYTDEGPHRLWAVPKLGKQLMAVWSELKANPRVCFLEPSEDPATVVAASDLTITFCFSSVSSEALGAGLPGIWYEPGERWRETFYGKEPLLTAHGYEELKALVHKLLYEMTLESYQAFLQEKALGPVDGFMDGQGLTRFRRLLSTGEASAEQLVPPLDRIPIAELAK